MTIQLDTLDNLDPQDLMREIHNQLTSTRGLFQALSLSEDERRSEFADHGLAYTPTLSSGYAESLAAYIAEELQLAERLAELLIGTSRAQANEPIDTTELSIIECRRLGCVTSESSRINAGEGLGTLLSGVASIIRWFTSNAEHIDPLHRVVPALIVISHRIEAIDDLTDGWVSVMMARRSKLAAT